MMSKPLITLKAAEVELIYRSKVAREDRPQVMRSKDAFLILRHYWDDNKIELLEEFKILLLDRGNTVLGIANVSTGGEAGCIADPKIIFSLALKARANGIILAHNHPSGNTKPSRMDIELTKRFAQAGNVLDICVHDHLILTAKNYLSMADEGLVPAC